MTLIAYYVPIAGIFIILKAGEEAYLEGTPDNR